MVDTPLVLVVDDDQEMRETVLSVIQSGGYAARGAAGGDEMWAALEDTDVGLIILDLSLVGEDGFDLTRELRKTSEVPVIMLTGRSDQIDKIVGLELGADDYVTKPFHNRELLARVKAVLRRNVPDAVEKPHNENGQQIRFGKFILDKHARSLAADDTGEISLTTLEFNILLTLISGAGRPLSRDQIYESIWNRSRPFDDRSIDVAVGKIRKKLDDTHRPYNLIKSERYIGYSFCAQVETA